MLTAEIQQILDIEAIKTLKAQYCLAVAKKDWKLFFELFADDLEFIQPNGSVYLSKAEFYANHKTNIQDMDAWGALSCTNPIITLTSKDTAEGIWSTDDYHVFPKNPELNYHGFGHYYEDYVRTSHGWLFQRIEPIFHRIDPYARDEVK